jgi:MbtH protein
MGNRAVLTVLSYALAVLRSGGTLPEGPPRKRINDLYFIVRNCEDQYSIWRAGKEIPAGWERVGEPASKDACLTRIDEIWTDMRPASLRAAMAQAGLNG